MKSSWWLGGMWTNRKGRIFCRIYETRLPTGIVMPAYATPASLSVIFRGAFPREKQGFHLNALPFSIAFHQMSILPCDMERCYRSRRSTDFRMTVLCEHWTIRFCSKSDANPSSPPQSLGGRQRRPVVNSRGRECESTTHSHPRCWLVVAKPMDPAVDPYGGDIQQDIRGHRLPVLELGPSVSITSPRRSQRWRKEKKKKNAAVTYSQPWLAIFWHCARLPPAPAEVPANTQSLQEKCIYIYKEVTVLRLVASNSSQLRKLRRMAWRHSSANAILCCGDHRQAGHGRLQRLKANREHLFLFGLLFNVLGLGVVGMVFE